VTVDARGHPPDDDLVAVGALQEPVRRLLYRYVAGQPGEVSRDDAAAAAGIQRQLAAFHLDKLVDAGLLETSYRRLSGRTGPGAGRPAKLYRRSPGERMVTLPPRKYDLAAELLADAVDEAGDKPARLALAEVARRFGRRVGEQVRATVGPRASRDRRMEALAASLDEYGYEPRREGRSVRLSNCPFHNLAEGHRELVCGMNLTLVEGVVEGMQAGDLRPCLDPRPGECCVTVNPAKRDAG
jgi:predicted ArsR family transcriptional regulator